jgi:hypothetical protein
MDVDFRMQSQSLFITRLALLLALTLAFQLIGLPQLVTGPVINALLFLSCTLFGPWTALILGCLTPLAALIRGQLPPPLWPLAPCVAAANGILVVSFHALGKGIRTGSPKTGWMVSAVSILLPAFLKFGFMTFCMKALVPRILGHSLPPPLAVAFTAPQFFTALAGGVLALGMMKILKDPPR